MPYSWFDRTHTKQTSDWQNIWKHNLNLRRRRRRTGATASHVCICADVCVYLYVSVYIYIYTYVSWRASVCLCVLMCIFIGTINTYLHACVYVYTHVCMYACMHPGMHVCVYVIYMHTHIMHVHAQVQLWAQDAADACPSCWGRFRHAATPKSPP